MLTDRYHAYSGRIGTVFFTMSCGSSDLDLLYVSLNILT